MNLPSLGRRAIGAAVALVGLLAGATPVLASPIGDGTSNTIQVSATVDPAHHRVLLKAPVTGLYPGQRLGTVQLLTNQTRWVFTDIMVESLTGTTTGLSLNYANVNVSAFSRECTAGASVCLIESDGTYPPFG